VSSDHLDLFDDRPSFALDVFELNAGFPNDVREDVHGERQVLVEDFDVVAGVLFRGERVRADRQSNRLPGQLFSADRRAGPLNSMCSTKWANAALSAAFVPRAARQPDADADRPHLSHALGEDTKLITKNVRERSQFDKVMLAAGTVFTGGRVPARLPRSGRDDSRKA